MQKTIKTEEGLGIEYDEDVICDVCRSVSCIFINLRDFNFQLNSVLTKVISLIYSKENNNQGVMHVRPNTP